MPVDYWLHVCDRSRVEVEMYTDEFLITFEKSDFFSSCKTDVAGKLRWNEWGDCSVSCGEGSKIRVANSCIPTYARCYGMQIVEKPCNALECPFEGELEWNEWGDCSVTCGGGSKIRIANSCLPDGAQCSGIQVLEEPCNTHDCPHMPSSFLPAGTIVSWVPKPNRDSPDTTSFNSDTWIMCDGVETCKAGRFAGQVCSDLSDRVLVGAGKSGQILELKDATLPDHAHEHRHGGSATYSLKYKRGPDQPGHANVKKKKNHDVANKHDHNIDTETFVTIDFSKMDTAIGFISHITNPKVCKSTDENDLYSPHIRVMFMFKCL